MLNKSKLFTFLLLLPLLLIISCKDKKDFPEGLTILIKDITIKQLPSNDIFSQVEYIPLETLPECLLVENNMDVYVTDKYIIANNRLFRAGAYLFDRKTGKFLYEISKKGQGPNEYNFIYSFPFNESYELFYVINSLQRVGIDIRSNKVVEKVFKPVSLSSQFDNINYLATSIDNIFKMDSQHYIAYINNESGESPDLLVIFDKEGNIVKTYPNHQKYIKYRRIFDFNPGLFYNYDNQLYFKEYYYNDTVFQVNLDTIVPRFIFDLGEMKPSYLERQNTDRNRNCYWIDYVHETTNYIFFKYSSGAIFLGTLDKYYDGYYNKRNGELVASVSTSKELRGFVDENGLYPPFYISSINQSEEAVGIITATNLLDYMQKNKSTDYPPIFNPLQLDDNPIIVIAKLNK